MELTIRDIPSEVEAALNAKARESGRSVNDIAVEALSAIGSAARKRDLGAVAGTWDDDPAVDEVRRAHEQVDENLWR